MSGSVPNTIRLAALMLGLVLETVTTLAAPAYSWRAGSASVADTLASRIVPPAGFERLAVAPGSFAEWLRGLPLKPAGTPVTLFNGLPKFWAAAPAAVIDIDVGSRDLQQCADAIMRLRAEYLLSLGRTSEIAFDYTNGGRVDYKRWADGWRPRPRKKGVAWSRKEKADHSYTSFRHYMDQVFAYAGTYSLSRELDPVPVADMRIGDLFIKGGFPGHAMLVADMAENPATGERRFLLLQSYMPAQDMHIVVDPQSADASPWYRVAFGSALQTPEWTFEAGQLKRWR